MKVFPKKYLILIFFLFFLYGAFLRIYALPHASLWMDEGYSFHASKTLLETRGITLETGFVYGKSSIIFHIFEAVSLGVFGFNEWGVRFPSLIFGLLVCIGGFFVIRKLFPKHILLAFIFFITLLFSSWEIVWSLQGRMYMMLQLFFLFNLFLLWKVLVSSSNRLFLSLFLFFFVALLSAFIHPFGAVSFLLFFLFFPFFHRNKNVLFLYIFFLFGFLFWKAGNILYLLSSFHFYLPFYLRFFFDFHFFLFSFAILSSVSVLVFGSWFLKKITLFLLASILIPFSVLALFLDVVNYRYFFPLVPLVFLLSFLWMLLPQIFKKRFLLFSLLFLQMGAYSVAEFSFLPKTFHPLESDAIKYTTYRLYTPQPDFKSAFAHVAQQKKTDDLLITTFPIIARFYQVTPHYSLPFNWRKQVEWKDIVRSEYVNIPHLYDTENLHLLVQEQHGILLADAYSYDKLPDEVQGYIEGNMQQLRDFPGEKGPNEDSKIIMYRF